VYSIEKAGSFLKNSLFGPWIQLRESGNKIGRFLKGV
jgi:hypothetical protein